MLFALLLIFQIPFFGQALVIDDGNFVDQALQILSDPAAPYSFTIHLSKPFDFFEYFANPPGQAYFLAAVIHVFGRSELALHSACMLFSGVAVFAMYGLARELTGRGLLAAALLLATPAFALSSHTVMADTSAAALCLVALLLFVRGVDRSDVATLVAAGLAAGLATLFKYSALSLFPLMFLYLWLRGRLQAATLTPLVLAAVMFGAWCAASAYVYGEIHPLHSLFFELEERSWTGSLVQVAAVLMVPRRQPARLRGVARWRR